MTSSNINRFHLSESEKSLVLVENSEFFILNFESNFENSIFSEQTLRKTIIYLKYNL